MASSWAENIAKQLNDAITAGLTDGAKVIETAAVARTPRDSGDLAASAGTDVEDVKASIHFDTPYAAVVHEDLTDRHDDGRSKFLESALIDEADAAVAAVAAGMKRVIGR